MRERRESGQGCAKRGERRRIRSWGIGQMIEKERESRELESEREKEQE